MIELLRKWKDHFAVVTAFSAIILSLSAQYASNRGLVASAIGFFRLELLVMAGLLLTIVVRRRFFEPAPPTLKRVRTVITSAAGRLRHGSLTGADAIITVFALGSIIGLFVAGVAYLVVTAMLLHDLRGEVYYPRMLAEANKLERSGQKDAATVAYEELTRAYPNDRRTPDVLGRIARLNEMKAFATHYFNRPTLGGNDPWSAEKFYNVLTACDLNRAAFPCDEAISSYQDPVTRARAQIPKVRSCSEAASRVAKYGAWIVMDTADRTFIGATGSASSGELVCQALGLSTAAQLDSYLERRWLIEEVRRAAKGLSTDPDYENVNMFI